MNITDELRNWWVRKFPVMDKELHEDFTAIAERIDAEHERQLEVLYRDMSDAEYVKLPKDADGEVIHVGDELRDAWKEKNQGEVEWLMLGHHGWWLRLKTSCERFYVHEFHEWHHRHAPTVEDVLWKLLGDIRPDMEDEEAVPIVKAYAERLRLAEDGKEQ